MQVNPEELLCTQSICAPETLDHDIYPFSHTHCCICGLMLIWDHEISTHSLCRETSSVGRCVVS